MKLLPVAISVVLVLTYGGCTPDRKAVVRQAAQLVADANKKGDYAALLKYTYPTLVEHDGGYDSTLTLINKALKQMKAEGREVVTLSSKLGEPGNVVKIGLMLYSIVPDTTVTKIKGFKSLTIDSLIGISSDNGDNWYFVYSQQLDELKVLLPDVNKIKIPESTGPTLIIYNE